MAVTVKICGINSVDAAEAAALSGAEFLGFVFFAKSPRNVTPELANEISGVLTKNIKKVALIVDESDPVIESILKRFPADYLQLHGEETEARVLEIKKKFGLPIVKAIGIKNKNDLIKAKIFSKISDYVLLDSKPPEKSALPGGRGESFDWSLINENYFDFPWILSGGLTVKNVESAIEKTGAKFVDVSSGVESAPGKKDRRLIAKFVKKVKTIKS